MISATTAGSPASIRTQAKITTVSYLCRQLQNDYGANFTNSSHRRHHHHVAITKLGHLLTLYSLTYSEVSSVVSPGSFRLLIDKSFRQNYKVQEKCKHYAF